MKVPPTGSFTGFSVMATFLVSTFHMYRRQSYPLEARMDLARGWKLRMLGFSWWPGEEMEVKREVKRGEGGSPDGSDVVGGGRTN